MLHFLVLGQISLKLGDICEVQGLILGDAILVGESLDGLELMSLSSIHDLIDLLLGEGMAVLGALDGMSERRVLDIRVGQVLAFALFKQVGVLLAQLLLVSLGKAMIS